MYYRPLRKSRLEVLTLIENINLYTDLAKSNIKVSLLKLGDYGNFSTGGLFHWFIVLAQIAGIGDTVNQ